MNKLNDKKQIISLVLFCVVIIGFAISNNISFNDELEKKEIAELLTDSLLIRQVNQQDLLLGEILMLDSINLDNKLGDSIILEEIQKTRKKLDDILKYQKRIYQNTKE
jgi:hypothetical protein